MAAHESVKAEEAAAFSLMQRARHKSPTLMAIAMRLAGDDSC
jgi:hypothetical protein